MLIGVDANEANQKNRVGVGQFAFNVIRQLEKIDKRNSYLLYLKEPALPDLPKEREGWRYRVFGPSKLWTQVALPLKLFTQREKLSVFYSPSHYAPRLSPFPTVISIMDLWHHRHPEQFAKKDLYQLRKWESYSVKRASRIVTISEFSKSEIVKIYQYPPEKIMVAYPGYEKFKVQSFDKAQDKSSKFKVEGIKQKYGIEGDYLLYLGTLQPKKNLKGLLEAFTLVAKRNNEVNLVIAGRKGWLYGEIFQKVKDLGLADKVVFTGFVEEEEKPYLIEGAKAYILPSFYEGFGIPVAEAMALGVPVVAANMASLPEVGGEAAIYCNPRQTESIAAAIEKVLSLNKSQRDAIIARGRGQVKQFSWEKCARKVLETLESLDGAN
ncbi:MAG TPA: glycosyltransferase family 1 protein [Patescibacteria group bacterium]|nr:glycosyltransferase family 1 protein [Patescibacteria group bacterium]